MCVFNRVFASWALLAAPTAACGRSLMVLPWRWWLHAESEQALEILRPVGYLFRSPLFMLLWPFLVWTTKAWPHSSFLINPKKDKDLRKWAAEGLAYLTLDAEVKEDLIGDKDAIQALIDLAKVYLVIINPTVQLPALVLIFFLMYTTTATDHDSYNRPC